MNVTQEKEAIQNDCNFAVKTLAMLTREVPEAEMCNTDISVNAGGLRSCLELLLSMLEESGVNVLQEEHFQSMMYTLSAQSGNAEASSTIH